MRVRIVYFEGCPNAVPAEAFVRAIAEEIGAPITTEMVPVTSPQGAHRERMHGSPTIQINGIDVDPVQRSNEAFSFGCRVFGGAHGLPPRDMIVAALREVEDA